MIRIFIFLIGLSISFQGCTQTKTIPLDRATCKNPDFDAEVARTINFTVPTIGVTALKKDLNKVHLFDARAKEEYSVSHIPGAKFIGYSDFDKTKLTHVPKDAKVVVYCSIGYRSEKIGERLQEMGFTNVHNLYGSIFEWVNRGNEVVDENGTPTREVHVYNRQWSEWVEEGRAKKIW